MTKEDIIRALARRTGLTRREVAAVEGALVSEITEGVARGERVHVAGLGTFERRRIPEKAARRPRENTPMTVPAHDAPHFRPSQEFKDKVRGESTPTEDED